MMIQEPVEAGDVRLGPNGPATIRDLRISLHAFSLQYTTSEGWFGPYTDTEVAAMPLLCPAKVRRDDVFVRADGSQFTASHEDPNVKGLWKNACTTSMRIHEACLREGWSIERRGSVATLPPVAKEEPAFSSYQEPVKAGQVRMGRQGPVLIESIGDETRGLFRMRAAGRDDDELSYAPHIASLRLLSPAWEDIGMGDVFDRGPSGHLVIDQHQHRPSVRDRCLDSGWRLIARGSDVVQQEQPPPCTNMAAEAEALAAIGRRAPTRPATVADWTTIDEPRASSSAIVCGVDMSTTGSHAVIGVARLGEDGKLRVEANAAHPALPHWLEVGRWCRLNGIAHESTMVNVVNDAAEVYLRSTAGTFTYVLKVKLDHTMTASLAGLPLREMSPSEAREAYAERRAVNTQRAASLCEAPPRRVLDGFGQKRGPTWEWYQSELSRMLNICNERTPPALFVAEEIALDKAEQR